MTKKEMFVAIRDAVADNEEMVTFLNKEIALLEKKSNNRKPTKTQTENEKYRAQLLDYLREVQTIKTIKEMQTEIPGFSELKVQRITPMLTALINEGKVTRNYVKKVPYYSAI